MNLKLVKIENAKILNNSEGLEKLFIESYEGWDLVDEGVYYFYDPVVKYGIDTLKAGDKIEGFTLDIARGIVEFNISEDLNLTYKIEVV